MFQNIPESTLVVDRYVDFEDSVTYLNADWTTDSFKMEIREDWNGGTLVFTLESPADIIVSGDSTYTTLTLSISKENMAAFPFAINQSDTKILVFDIVKTDSVSSKEMVCARGEIELRPGSTQ